MKIGLIAAAALATLTVAMPAKAVTLVWTLSGVTFDDGGTAFGTFSTDSTTGGLITYSIDTTAGSTLGAFHYDATSSIFLGNNIVTSNSFLVANSSVTRYITFAFADPLTTGGINLFKIGGPPNSYECNNCDPLRAVTAGFATTSIVPEPASWALFVVGFGLVGVTARRRTASIAA